jgi:hypothetical protein
MLLLLALAIILVSLSEASEIVKVGDQNVSIDFGDNQVNITSTAPYSAAEVNVNQVNFVSDDLVGSIAICKPVPFEEHSILVSNCDQLLKLLMKQSSVNVDVTPYEDGFFGTGECLATGDPSYALLKPDDVDFGRASRLLVVISSSSDEKHSKSIISSATIADE